MSSGDVIPEFVKDGLTPNDPSPFFFQHCSNSVKNLLPTLADGSGYSERT
jgi:hypothetical protein